MKKPELLAPAGDFQKLRMAVLYGADAVYLAGESYGMRGGPANFKEEELAEAIRFSHEHRVKVHVTVNIMPRNKEVQALPEYLEFLDSAGADALIIADLGTFELAKKYAPHCERHISTQVSVVNYETACAWHALGAKRVVLARELALSEIREIREKTPKDLEIETFVHGAMCISYSGRCLLSNYLTGRDGNGGACAQPCRYRYTLHSERTGNAALPIEETEEGSFILSSNDLCMIGHLKDLIDAGVDSFKIEGRAKNAYYAAVVTGAYRHAVDECMTLGTSDSRWAEEVKKISHRPYSTGFYYGQPGQYYESKSALRDCENAGIVSACAEDGTAVVEITGIIPAEAELEILNPCMRVIPVPNPKMRDENGELLSEVTRHPCRILMQLPEKADAGSILRWNVKTENG